MSFTVHLQNTMPFFSISACVLVFCKCTNFHVFLWPNSFFSLFIYFNWIDWILFFSNKREIERKKSTKPSCDKHSHIQTIVYTFCDRCRSAIVYELNVCRSVPMFTTTHILPVHTYRKQIEV